MNFINKIFVPVAIVFTMTACGVDDNGVSETNSSEFELIQNDKIIESFKTAQLNGGFTGEYQAIKFTAKVLVATNKCNEINADKIKIVKSVIGDTVYLKAVGTPRRIYKEILCTAQYQPIYKNFSIRVDYNVAQKIVVKNVGDMDVEIELILD
jgi:hypothetical protein